MPRAIGGHRGVGVFLWAKQTPVAQGRSTKIDSTIKWIRASRFLIKSSPSGPSQQSPKRDRSVSFRYLMFPRRYSNTDLRQVRFYGKTPLSVHRYILRVQSCQISVDFMYNMCFVSRSGETSFFAHNPILHIELSQRSFVGAGVPRS